MGINCLGTGPVVLGWGTIVWVLLGKRVGFLGGSDGQESACDVGDPSSILEEDPQRRAWHPTPVFLPDPIDRGALVGCSITESDTFMETGGFVG